MGESSSKTSQIHVRVPPEFKKALKIFCVCEGTTEQAWISELIEIELKRKAFGLWSKKPIRNMSDLKGTKVRAVGELAEVLAKIGAAPVYIPHEESFMALQLGTIDAYSTGIHCWKLFKHYEICNYIMLPAPMPCGTDNYVISLKALKQLPPDLQTLVKAFGPSVGYYMSWKSREMADFILKEAPSLKGQLIQWDQEIVDTLAKEGLALLKNKYAPKSDRTRSMVNIISNYMKDKGYIK